MNVGVNLTSPITSETALALLRAGHADFCELLIDNFMHLDAQNLRGTLGDVPIAFHVMNSRFLENDEAFLAEMASRLRSLIGDIQPLYVSDHLGHFSHGRRRLPMVMELDYTTELDATAARIDRWQALLGVRVYLENYPSTFAGGRDQIAFFEKLVERTGCGILFDISNAVVAELNCGLPADEWAALARHADHFHIAGYTQEASDPPVTVDSHDTSVSARSLAVATRIAAARGQDRARSVTVERDANFSAASWLDDLQAVRRAIA